MIEVCDEKTEQKIYKPIDESIGETLLKKLNLENDYNDFLVLILKVKYSQDFLNFDIFGKTSLDYIFNAVSFCKTKIVEYNLEEDILKVIKQNLEDKKYVAVLFSDTPLLKRQTFFEILDYFRFKKLCALKFNRGFCFECEYLKSVDKIYNPQVQDFCEEDFFKVTDEKSFTLALNILKNRIISFHQNNGVIIKHPESTFIDASVNIEKGVVLENNVNILGNTTIKSNSKIGYNSSIKNCIIEKNCQIENSSILNTIIKENCKILDFCVIKNVTIDAGNTKTNEKIIGGE